MNIPEILIRNERSLVSGARIAAYLFGMCALSPTAQAQSSLTNIGTLGGSSSFATSVSADGTIVVGTSNLTGNAVMHAFRWSSSGMIDLGTLGSSYINSWAYGISADGSAIVGMVAKVGNSNWLAYRWTSGGGMASLGTLGGGNSDARAVSADGTVVVGSSTLAGNPATHAFRWVQGATGGVVSNTQMYDLGTLGGTSSYAKAVSSDGAVVVGSSDTVGNGQSHAFRWANGSGMSDLGTLGGMYSRALGVSSDGSVVVGESRIAGDSEWRAFRWTSAGGMTNLGALGGTVSSANGVSGDGRVVVGYSYLADDVTTRAFRWTQATGMQSVDNWLRANGVTVPVDITKSANATNRDGSVVVGYLTNDQAYIARVGSGQGGSGLITLADVQNSLGTASSGSGTVLRAASTVLNGAHSNPQMRRVAPGQNNFWLAGDWGRDDHGARNGDLGMAEIGVGRNFGPAQLNLTVGQTWANQTMSLNSTVNSQGSYLLAEALIPLGGNLWGTLGGFSHHGQSDLRRGYLNAGVVDYSKASPNVDTWGLRARLDWEKALRIARVEFSPYVDLTQSIATLSAYSENGGGFPARFDARKDKATELRLGVNAAQAIAPGLNLVGTLEAAHRFESSGARTSGELIGLFAFNLDGQKNKQDWLRARFGVEGKLAEGIASIALNVTTQGESPNAWLAASWQKAF